MFTGASLGFAELHEFEPERVLDQHVLVGGSVGLEGLPESLGVDAVEPPGLHVPDTDPALGFRWACLLGLGCA